MRAKVITFRWKEKGRKQNEIEIASCQMSLFTLLLVHPAML
jgi:hypothetical protein